MSRNIEQVYNDNPSTTAADDDLFYKGNTPYGAGDDSAIKFSDLQTSLFSENQVSAYQSFGQGSRSDLKLTDADFVGGVYTLTNPCPNIIGLECDNPGNVLELPSAQGPDSFALFEGPEIINIGTQTVSIVSFLGIPQTPSIANSDYNVKLTDKSTTGGLWDFIPRTIVQSWNGSLALVDVTAGSGIDITDGVISLTGTGASIAYGGSFTNNNIYTTSFTDATTWKGIRVNNFTTVVTNFVIGFDGSNQIYYEYVGLETAKFRIGLSNRIRTVNNINPNTYNYSLGIDSGSGIVPVYLGLAVMQFVTQGNDDLDAILVPYNMVVELNPNDKLYPIIQNRGDVNPTNNEYIVTYLLADIEKIGDVGGAAAGVTSLNGLTGTLSIAGPDGSVGISTSGDDINLSVGQYIPVAGTSQAMLANKSYICMNTGTTSLSLPTANCPAGSCIEIAGYGGTVGTFIITQSSGQAIFMGIANTSFGAGGTLTTDTVGGSNLVSALKLVCVQANTIFMVVSSQGNFVLS